MLGCRVLQIAINDLEGARERHAEPAHDFGQLTIGILIIGEVELRPCGQLIQDRM